MDSLRKAIFIAGNGFKKWAINPRMYILLILLFGFISMMLSPIRTFCADSGYNVNPCVFPFLMTEPYSITMIMLGLVLLFCDAPFIENEQPYIVVRSGRKTWTSGQLIYIFLASGVYFLVVILLSILVLLPHISLDGEWGKVINTFCQTSMAKNYGIVVPFDYTITSVFSPIEAVFTELVFTWLIGTMMGMLIFFLNLKINRSAGAIAGSIIAMLPLFVRKTEMVYNYFSPASWASFSVVDFRNATTLPSNLYVISILIFLIFLLSFLIIMSMRHKDIDVLKSV